MRTNENDGCHNANEKGQCVANDDEEVEPPPLPQKFIVNTIQNIDNDTRTDIDCVLESNCNTSCQTSSLNIFPNADEIIESDSDGERAINAVISEDYDNVQHIHEMVQEENIPLNEEKEAEELNTDDSDSEDVSRALLEEHYDNVECVSDINLKKLDENNAEELDDEHVAVVSHKSSAKEDKSWTHLLVHNNQDQQARKAVHAFGYSQPPERSFFGYKRWLRRLSQRRRFEILVVLGLFMWFAFFIILAIIMNGRSSTFKDSDNGSSINSFANQFSMSTVKNDPSGYLTTVIDHHTSDESFLARNSVTTAPTFFSVHQPASPFSDANFGTTSMSLPKTDHSISNETIGNAELSPTSVKETRLANNTSNTNKSTSSTPAYSPSYAKQYTLASSLSKPTTSSQEKATRAITPTVTLSNGESEGTIGSQTNMLLNQILYDVPHSVSLPDLLKEQHSQYLFGIGRADITGPAADVNMMGYANPSQISGGLHMRQYARTFVIGHQSTRVVFVNIDACMGSLLVKLEVLKRLQATYGDLYTTENVCISGTHTHSAPAGFLQDVLFQVTSKGYVPETLKAMVDGIVESIRIAHENVAPGSILINKGELLESNINRSPSAYINNPENERKKYKYNVDKDMILLKFLDSSGKGIGMLNWFPVHCTSLNNTNSLISGDNKGYAELLFEQAMDPGTLFGESKFVAAFAQSNEGDVSPNTRGPRCIDTGLPCDNAHSTCDGKVTNCVAVGPGKDMFESTKIIGNNQFEKAMELYKEARILLSGPVEAVHQYIDMSNQKVSINSTHSAHTCKPAMGFSFAAGTTDGPGAFDFKQGDRSGNLFWRTVRNFLHSPSEEQKRCHSPKPILLDTGEMQFPYQWQPTVVDTQIFRIGNLIVNSVPGEFTTMSGRRLRDAVLEVFTKGFPTEKFESVIAGLSNTYADYIATFEEYQVQRYEGASTIHGPHTLCAYVHQFKRLANSLLEKKPLAGGAEVHDIKDKLLSFVPGVIADSTPFGYSFGDVLKEANDTYNVGDVVSVQFVSGNPRSSPTMNMTFLTVERDVGSEQWQVIHTDASWDTRYIWERSSTLGSLRGISEVTVKWVISPSTPSGRYRIKHFGHYLYFWNRKIYPYNGHSKTFYVSGKY